MSDTVIETPRLRLRRHRAGDFENCAALWADPAVTRYIGGKPMTREESWTRLLRYVGHWELLGFGYWVVEEKETGSFAGEAGLAEYRREIEPSIEGVPEAGWAFVPRVYGRGYATEAVSAALQWGEAHLPSKRAVCIIQPENAASIRVAQKCGFRESGRATYRAQSLLLMSRGE